MSGDQGSGRRPVFDAGTDRQRFPVLSPELLAELATSGTRRVLEPCEVIYHGGEALGDFFVVLEGEVEVVTDEGQNEAVLVCYGPGQFLGELGLLTGQRTYTTARATASSATVLVLSHDAFRDLMVTRPTASELIVGALIGRREALRASPAARAIQIIGSRYSSEAMALRTFASRNGFAHTWVDVDEAADAGQLLAGLGLRAGDTPVVVTSGAVLRHPTPGEFAELLGLTYRGVPGRVFDLVVVGVGPAGLAASVYGASEGLDTVSLDAVGPGGQAGSTSRIENYAGFPNGISGGDLTARTALQAQRLGAMVVSPCEAAAMRVDDGFHVVTLTDNSEIPCRSIVVATGARYRRLALPNLQQFEGRGVYYAATDLEARSCRTAPVVVVGGGNSAGQAALFLSQQDSEVTMVVRRPDLAADMSRYLIDRIGADDRIEVRVQTEVRALEGGGTHLERAVLERSGTGERQTVPCSALFCFIGAEPVTSWLAGSVALDPNGFVLTDRWIPKEALTDPVFSTREPLPFETSAPGVFAVGDVRLASMKRVASAVGEGSSAIRSVHEYLASAG